MSLQFKCKQCGKMHEGIPIFHADRPAQYWDVPESQRDSDVFLTTDSCVIADRFFFIHGCLEIPIIGMEEVFGWGVWISLKKENFLLWQDYYQTSSRSHIGPFFGWLCTRIPVYPDTMNLKAMVYLRNNGIRPFGSGSKKWDHHGLSDGNHPQY